MREKTVLIVTGIVGAENLARALSREANAVVEIARSRRAALARLRRDPVSAVLLDTSLPDSEMTTSDMIWQNAGGAVPLEINISVLGAAGVVRLLRNLLDGREQAETLGRREATTAVAQELQSTITSLLLQSDLMLRDKSISPAMANKVREVKELTDSLRTRLRSAFVDDPVRLGAPQGSEFRLRMAAMPLRSAMLPETVAEEAMPASVLRTATAAAFN